MDVVGKSKIAARCGVRTEAVRYWMAKEDWPPPRGYSGKVEGGPGSRPFWSWRDDILPFLDRHPHLGRLRR